MNETKFGGANNSSRGPSPLDDLAFCKSMTLETSLLSRKLATTKYLHAYNLGRNSKLSRTTENSPPPEAEDT